MGICDSKCKCGANNWHVYARNDFGDNVIIVLKCNGCGNVETLSAEARWYEGGNLFIRDAVMFHKLGEEKFMEWLDEAYLSDD